METWFSSNVTYVCFIQEDVVGVNSKSEGMITVKVQNPKTGKIEEVKVKEKWINPSDENAQGGGYPHSAVTPESLLSEKDKTKKKKLFSFKKKEEKPIEYSPYPYSEFKTKRKRKS